jgi:hypothetical protein
VKLSSSSKKTKRLKVTQAVNELKELFRSFKEAHEAVVKTLEEEKDLDEAQDYFEDMRETYMVTLTTANEYTSRDPNKTNPISAETSSVTREELQYMMNLPKLTLEPFDGNPLQYHTFTAVFDQNVGCIPGNEDAKLSRLLEYTCGRAKEAIRREKNGGEGRGKKTKRDRRLKITETTYFVSM